MEWKQTGNSKIKNSYVRPEDNMNMKFVNDYHRKLKDNNPRMTRGNKAMLTNFLVSLLILILLLPTCFNQALINIKTINNKVDFDFCEIKDDLKPINIGDLCNNKSPQNETNLYIMDWLYNNYGEMKNNKFYILGL